MSLYTTLNVGDITLHKNSIVAVIPAGIAGIQLTWMLNLISMLRFYA
jgi:hypothetical protein